MPLAPHEVLGVAPDASRATVRRAFRRLVLDSHPDRHGGAVEYNLRLRSIVDAYHRMLGHRVLRDEPDPTARRSAPAYRPPPRSRDTWSCPRCDDSWSFQGECPRCAVPLHDAPRELESDPRVDAMISALEKGTRFSGEFGPEAAGGFVIVLVTASGFVSYVHTPLATMLLAYAVWLSGLEWVSKIRAPGC